MHVSTIILHVRKGKKQPLSAEIAKKKNPNQKNKSVCEQALSDRRLISEIDLRDFGPLA